MSLAYQDNKIWMTLWPILEDHSEWFHRLLHVLFYADKEAGTMPQKPVSFAQWVAHVQKDDKVQAEIIERLSLLHADMSESADALLRSATENVVKPEHKVFVQFMTLYEEFLRNIRRLEKDLLLEGNGYDVFTGLRSGKLISADAAREMDRLARHGKGFCVALARISNFEVLKAHASDEEVKGYIRLVADLIKLSVRSFDDAYYMAENEFALSLKQTDVSGGISALERLRQELENQNVQYHDGTGMPRALSISCCIAEPVESDDIGDLLKNLRSDLNRLEGDPSNTVLQYHELSPLQRFVQKGQ